MTVVTKIRKSILMMRYLLTWGYVHRIKSDAIKDFMPGVYEREGKGWERDTRDTLTITRRSLLGDLYLIEISTVTLAGTDGRQLAGTASQEAWIAGYDPFLRQLVDDKLNNVISFSPETGELFLRDGRYKKITNPADNGLDQSLVPTPVKDKWINSYCLE